MAVNYANGLSELIGFSGLIATRKEGVLKLQLENEVHYGFLNKKNNYDFRAFFKLRSFCRANRVEYIHAHSSSFFWAVLVKLTIPKLKVIWHDHYGNRVNEKKANFVLKLCSFFFSLIVAVNYELKNWSEKNLKAKKTIYLPNFSMYNDGETENVTILEGVSNKRVVFLANLKVPKNHITFLEAFYMSGIFRNGWTLHLIGKDFKDEYSNTLKEFVTREQLEKSIYFYGSRGDIPNILGQANIGVLCSTYEGFPVTLIEYGMFGLSVLSTDVGFCKHLIQKGEGVLFDPNDTKAISTVLQRLLENDTHAEIIKFGKKFKEKIKSEFSAEKILSKYLENVIYDTV